MKSILGLLVVFFVQVSLIRSATVEDLEDAKLLVLKNVMNNYVVEGTDIVVKYSIYNIGNQAAINVKLIEDNFPHDEFQYVSGFRQVIWPKIAPGSNVTHLAIVKPLITGEFDFTPATVKYLPNDKTQKVQIGHSTELGKAFIQNYKEYNRKYASHTLDWILFAVMCSPSLAFPFFLWFNSKKKYDALKKESKRESKKE